MQSKPIRHWLAVCLLVGTSLISGFYSFLIDPPEILIMNDGATLWEARMQLVRERLPDSVREIGYISDPENLGSVIQEYLLTKYALLPVAVRQGTEFEWIVGNFTQPGFQEILDAQLPEGYTLESLGAGIYLIHRSKP